MWRYFEKVDDPKKRKRSDEERAAAKKVYEEKGKRKWLGAKWKEGGQQEWLEYDEEEKVMFCTWCKKYEPKAKFVWCNKGTPNLKLESVKEHENSTTHRKSVAAEKAARNNTKSLANLKLIIFD